MKLTFDIITSGYNTWSATVLFWGQGLSNYCAFEYQILSVIFFKWSTYLHKWKLKDKLGYSRLSLVCHQTAVTLVLHANVRIQPERSTLLPY